MIEILNGDLRQWDRGREVCIVPDQGDTVNTARCFGEGDEEARNSKLRHEDGKVLAEIPDELLQRSGILSVSVAVRSSDGCCRTIDIERFYVWPHPKPVDYDSPEGVEIIIDVSEVGA